MRIGLVSYKCKNNDTAFNMSQIKRAMKYCEGKADLLCFGEVFLQGFDALVWDYETDKSIAVSMSSETIKQLCFWTKLYGISLVMGYFEKAEDALYSSCAVISEGEIIHNYRRISKGWKEYTLTDEHYCEGTEITHFTLLGKKMCIALCGDLWDEPYRFQTDSLLIWPVYVNYTTEEWNGGILEEYAVQAVKAANHVLMINPLDDDPMNHGGSFCFQNGKVIAKLPFDEEGILIVNI